MTRLVGFHHRKALQPATAHDYVVEAVRFLLVGVAVGCVMAWAWSN